MPPKKGDKKPSYLKTCPDSHMVRIRLDDDIPFEDEYKGGIYSLRTLFSLDGRKIKWKPLASTSSDSYFVVELSYYDYRSQVIMQKCTLYIYAFTAKGKWRLVKDAPFEIEGGDRMTFSSLYPANHEFNVGRDTLISCVMAFQSDNLKSWKNSYYDLIPNLSEAIRLPPVFRFISKSLGNQLPMFEKWVAKNWKKLSKIWKFWCRYEVWDPLGYIPKAYKDPELTCDLLKDELVGWRAIAVLVDVPLDADEMADVEEMEHPVKDEHVK